MNDNWTRIDDAIDRAVRDIMRRDPPAGFRGRVLSRLDAPSRRTLLWPALATAGALAAVVLAVLVLRDAPPTPSQAGPQVAEHQPTPAPPRTDDARPVADVTLPAPEPPARRAPRAAPLRTATFGPRDGRVAAASLPLTAPAAATEPVIPPPADAEPDAALPPPIVIRPLSAPGPIEVAPIVVPPIRIPRMPNTPVPPPRGGEE
jgi:hypothetical protein